MMVFARYFCVGFSRCGRGGLAKIKCGVSECVQPLHRLERCEFHFLQYVQNKQKDIAEEIDEEFNSDFGKRRSGRSEPLELFKKKIKPINSGCQDLIYFILVESSPKAVKVGVSGHPRTRLRSLQVSSPFKLRLIGTIEGSYEQESIIHDALFQYKLRGEWFICDGKVKKMVAGLESGKIKDFESLFAE